MSRSSSATANGAWTAAPRGPFPSSYRAQSQLPLTSLVFLLPLIVLYEVGTRLFASDPAQQTEQRIIAFKLMQDFFGLFGASGRYLPAMAVGGVLLAWHITRNDPWRVNGTTLLGMGAESAFWALPLLVTGIVTVKYLSNYLTLLATAGGDWKGSVVLSVGAGVYEELVFRLAAFSILSLILMDWLKLRPRIATMLVVLISSIVFALYHYLGGEPFSWASLTFRTIAGIYFGGLYLLRGFGVTAAAHVNYDVYVVLLRALR